MNDKTQVTVRGEGTTRITRAADGTPIVASDSPLSIDTAGKPLRSVGIHNLVDVANHTINEQVGFISHLVTFRDGGTVEFAFNIKGEIIKLQGKNVLATVQNGNEVTFKMRPPEAPTEPASGA